MSVGKIASDVVYWLAKKDIFYLMDIQMPEMDGLEAARQIRAIEAGREIHVPIVALTAGALKEEQEKCFAAGMDDFLAKPVEPASLAECLAKFLPTR